MLNARMEALQEHNDRLGALISDLQIKRANQVHIGIKYIHGFHEMHSKDNHQTVLPL